MSLLSTSNRLALEVLIFPTSPQKKEVTPGNCAPFGSTTCPILFPCFLPSSLLFTNSEASNISTSPPLRAPAQRITKVAAHMTTFSISVNISNEIPTSCFTNLPILFLYPCINIPNNLDCALLFKMEYNCPLSAFRVKLSKYHAGLAS